MRRMLVGAGHECLEAEDGLAGVAAIAQKEAMEGVHVVLMDNNMPRMGGPEAIMEMRRRGYKGVIVGVSGDVGATQEFLDAGADDALVKPVTQDGLLNTLQSFVASGATP